MTQEDEFKGTKVTVALVTLIALLILTILESCSPV